MALAYEWSQSGEPRSRAHEGVRSVWGRLPSSGGQLAIRGEAGLEMIVWGSAEPLEWEVRDWSSKQRPSHSPGDPHGGEEGAAGSGGSRACWTF